MNVAVLRAVLIGDTSVGKTSLLSRIVKNQFIDTTATLVAAKETIFLGENKTDPIDIWDTAGSERYLALNTVYYHNAAIGIILFDVCNAISFQKVSNWSQEFINFALIGASIIVVANKIDLIDQRSVTTENAKKWSSSHGFHYCETSAVEGTGIHELLNLLKIVVREKDASSSNNQLLIPVEKSEKGNGCCKI